MSKSQEMKFFQSPNNTQLRYCLTKSIHTDKQQAVLVLPGRSSFIEQYDETVRRLQHLGFDVWVVDLPGQGGSSRYRPNLHSVHIEHFDEYLETLESFIKKILLTTYLSENHFIWCFIRGTYCISICAESFEPDLSSCLYCTTIWIK